jgi:hypothetical protein
MWLKDELERIIALEEASKAPKEDNPDSQQDSGQGLFAPLMAALRDLRASLDRRPRA